MKKSSGGMSLHSGLTNRSPKCSNLGVPAAKTSSTVNSDSVRSSTAPTPKTIGGREA